MFETWRELAVENADAVIGWGGLAIGVIFGLLVQRTNFCTMGSLSDIVNFGDWRRFRSWLLAGAVAMVGVYVIETTGFGDMSNSIYVSQSLPWGGHIIGGFIFGVGMVLSGGCVSKTLVRAGAGDLRSLMVLWAIGGSAYMTIGGLFAETRVAMVAPMTLNVAGLGLQDQRLSTILAAATGLDLATAYLLAMVVLAGGVGVWCLKDRAFRSSMPHMVAGVGIGLCVIAGWVLTSMVFDEFADNPTVASLSYVRPAGDTIDYLMRFTADKTPNFAVVTTIGALLGSFIGSVTQGRFQLATFSDANDTLRNLAGGVLMGFGGVTALGCTIGQAVTGVSTLSVGSMMAFASIVLGGVVTMKVMERFV